MHCRLKDKGIIYLIKSKLNYISNIKLAWPGSLWIVNTNKKFAITMIIVFASVCRPFVTLGETFPSAGSLDRKTCIFMTPLAKCNLPYPEMLTWLSCLCPRYCTTQCEAYVYGHNQLTVTFTLANHHHPNYCKFNCLDNELELPHAIWIFQIWQYPLAL